MKSGLQLLGILTAICFGCICTLAADGPAAKPGHGPTLFIIGDSTVKNGSGKGDGGLWGWGDFMPPLFDTTKINIANRALGGRSSRTFLTEGLWDKVLQDMQPGDFVIMQFGHNDGGPLNSGKARASIKGNGDESQEVVMEGTGKKEIVHSYGWYLRKYIADAKAKGATAIVCSPIPRDRWTDGKVNRADKDYGKWAGEAAQAAGAFFVDLNAIIAARYDADGQEKVAAYFGKEERTHTSEAGAKLNAACVVEGIRQLKDCPLVMYLR